MPLQDDDLLDITRPVKDILIDKFSRINGIVLLPADFEITNVSPVTTPGASDNTKATLSPRASSHFYNQLEFTYNRLVLDDILDEPRAAVMRTSEVTVHDLLPKINAAYGINLTVDDIFDDVLPPVDPIEPNAQFVTMLAALPTSLLVVGNYVLNVNTVLGEDTSGLGDYQTFYVVSSTGNALREHTMSVQTTQGTAVTGFDFLSNAQDVSKVRVDKVMTSKAGGETLLFGEFTLRHPGTVLPTAQTYRFLKLNSQGAVVGGYRTMDPIASAAMVTTSKELDMFYYVTGTTVKAVSKTTMLAAPATDFTPFLTGYPQVAGIQTTKEGHLYVYTANHAVTVPDPFNPAMTATAQFGRLDRYTSNGVLDAGWARPIFAVPATLNSGFVGFAATENDAGLVQDSVYALFNPPQMWSTRQVQTGTPVVVNETMRTPACAFNPIVRLSKTGAPESGFDRLLAGYGPSLLESDELGQQFSPDVNYLTAVGEGVALLIKRRNTASAQFGWSPVVFDKTGKLLGKTTDDQSDDRLITHVKGITSLSFNSILVWGTATGAFSEGATGTHEGVFLFSPEGEYRGQVLELTGQTVSLVAARELV